MDYKISVFAMKKSNSNRVKILELHQVHSFLLQCVLIMPKMLIAINYSFEIIIHKYSKYSQKILASIISKSTSFSLIIATFDFTSEE